MSDLEDSTELMSELIGTTGIVLELLVATEFVFDLYEFEFSELWTELKCKIESAFELLEFE